MTSQRVLAAGRKRSQATTRLLIAVRRAERLQGTPEDVSSSRARGALVTDTHDAPPRKTAGPGAPSIERD
jgi:hypothetical protein